MHTACGNEKLQKYQEEIKRFERELEERHRGMMREELREFLEQLDREGCQELLREGGYESKGREKRKIEAGCGPVELRVHRYEHRSGRTCYPLRDVCGVGKMTPLARERCVRVAVERPYGMSAELLQELCGMQVSRMRVWQVIQEEGRQEQSGLEEDRERVFSEAREVGDAGGDRRPAVVELDGTLIATREEGERDVYGRKRMEVKLGALFRGVRPRSRKRKETIDRFVYGQITDAESFGEQWYTCCAREGVTPQTPVHLLGDGAPWIRNVGEGMFPGCRYTLDLYHVEEYARRVLVDHQYRRFCSLVHANLPRTALQYVQGLHPSDRDHRKDLQGFCSYLNANLDGMRYIPGDIHGSGVIEKVADLLVKKRMKRQGMTWSRRGANAMLVLRARYLNQRAKRNTLRHSLSATASP